MMILKKVFSAPALCVPALLLSLLTFNGCSDEFSSVGSQLLNKENSTVKALDSVIDSLNVSRTNFKEIKALGTSTTFLIGRYNDLTSYTLLKFDCYNSDLVSALKNDSITVVSATMKLTPQYQYGDTLSSFGFQAHLVNEFWDPYQFTADSLDRISYNKTDLIIEKNVADTPYTFKLDQQTVLGWMKYDAVDSGNVANHGIMLEPSRGINKVVGFYGVSYYNDAPPVMEVIYVKTGSAPDTITFDAIYDVHAVTSPEAETSSPYLILQSGVTYSSRLFFDISSIPKSAVINSAELLLTIDTTQSKFSADVYKELRAYAVTDSSKNYYTSSGAVTLTPSGNVYSGKFTSYAAVWHAKGSNLGIVITPALQNVGLEKFVFYGFDAADVNKRPRLKIIYSVFN